MYSLGVWVWRAVMSLVASWTTSGFGFRISDSAAVTTASFSSSKDCCNSSLEDCHGYQAAGAGVRASALVVGLGGKPPEGRRHREARAP